MYEELQLRNIARVNANVACALIRLEGMKAENAQRAITGAPPAYTEHQFNQIILDEEIGYNAVLATLQNGL